jgi:hypothetical protein
VIAPLAARHTSIVVTLALAASVLGPVAPAAAQLRETEVVVVYDARIADSVAVAEFYAGSSRVTGATGTFPGLRPRVRLVNLQALGGGFSSATTQIDYPTFKSQLRDPLRAWLNTGGPTGPGAGPFTGQFSRAPDRRVRCLVLTKGLPHRLLDQSLQSGLIGDNPGGLSPANIFTLTYASVDSELTLLMQNLDAGEAGGNADSPSDGMQANPFAGSALPMNAFGPSSPSTPKNWPQLFVDAFGTGTPQPGFIWGAAPGPLLTNINPGDVMMVCRLDGTSVANVRAMLDRAQNLQVDTQTATIILDSDGRPFDSTKGLGAPYDTPAGGDWAAALAAFTADGRFLNTNVRSNFLSGVSNFFVGPLISFGVGPVVVNSPVVMLASFGANHTGVGAPANTTYGQSFNFAPGAIFNSMESYNGRAFGSLGQLAGIPQQQLSDVIAAGATFGVGNVWEPFSLAVARNQALARNFLLGGMTWAEAAYSAVPVLSWQTVVLGDPLARVTRVQEDTFADGRVDINDLYAWYTLPRDINRDGSPTPADAQLLESAIRGYEPAAMKHIQR